MKSNTNLYLFVFSLMIIFGIAGFVYTNKSVKGNLEVFGKIPTFELVNQEGKTINSNEFIGKTLIVNFIFTSCPATCPLLTQQMQKMQEETKAIADDIIFLTISVDPETDKPNVLLAYGKKYKANFKNWVFLTGPINQIEKAVVGGFKLAMDQGEEKHVNESDPSSLMELTHSEQFVLVDKQGQIRAYRTVHTDPQRSAFLELINLI
jgi:protein SCO1/2